MLQEHLIASLTVFTVELNICRFRNSDDIVSAFKVDPLFLKHEHQGSAPDYRVRIVNC